MADNTLETGNTALPKDLAITSQPDTLDNDKFKVVATNLKINSGYTFQFQYVYPDGTVSEWSPGYSLLTDAIATLPKPKLTSANVTYFQGILKVTWDGTDYNNTPYGNGFSRILIWVRDNSTPGQLFKIVGELTKPGTWSLAVPPKSQTVKLSAVTVNGEESAYSDEFTVTPVVAPPSLPTNVVGAWNKADFTVTFNHNPSNSANEYLKEYIITLNGAFTTKSFPLIPIAGNTQVFGISEQQISGAFLNQEVSFTGTVRTLDIYNQLGVEVPINNGSAVTYVSSLAAPTITSLTETVNGYKVGYSSYSSTDPFKEIEVHEVVSSASTDPGTGYAKVQSGTSNPLAVPSGVGKRWVKIRALDTKGVPTAFSTAQSVIPIDIVAAAVDAEAPGAIQSATAVASPDASDTGGTVGLITLTIVNSTSACPSDFNGYIVKILRSSDSKEWTQSFNSKTYLTTLPVNLGIAVGQSYTLSVATTDGRNQSAFVNVTGNPISVTDNRTNTSVATNLVLSATDSILTAKWTAPVDPQVELYRVQLTSTFVSNVPDFTTPLQEIYANSTVVSFGGLTASTKYGIRVTTKYSGTNGALSTNHLIGSVTLDSSGAISDGIAPTTNPSITTANVKSLFGAFAITFPAITNADDVKYEVFIKPTNATGIVDNQYKVLEIGGTFAVVKTLADKTTALSYGTDYYIAIRAKDNDGVSTGTVTAVGPVQTLQVSNADLAADSVYANNIKAGEIDASKMITNLLFVDKTINVGESTSLNRIQLASSIATPITMTDTDLPSPSTYSVKSRIFIGAGNYYSSGTSFYADNTGRFSIGDKLKFDGTNLTVNGSGTFTGLLTTGTGSSLIKVGTGANGANNGLYIQQGNQYIYTDGTFSFGGGNLTGTSSSVTISGTVTVKGNSELQGDLKLVSPGVFYIGANKASGQRLLINDAGIAAYNSGGTRLFALDTTGYLEANNAKIGSWLVDSTSIYKNSNYTLGGNSVSATVKLDSSTNEIKATGSGINNIFEVGMGLPTATESKVFWAGTDKANAAFYVTRNGTVNITGSVTITGYATTGQLDSTNATVATKIGAADVNANVTSISGGVISTGAIQSNNYSAPTVGVGGTTPYSVAGTRFDITNGSIVSKSFVINSDGSAAFKGTLSSGISIDAPVITGGQINIGNGNFKVSTSGVLEATGAIISGNITATLGSVGGWTIGSTSLSGGGVTLSSAGSITVSKTDTLTGAVQTTSLANGNISLSNNGTTFLSSNSISITGKNLATETATTTMAPAYFSLQNPSHTGIITMNGSSMQIYGGSGMNVSIGGGGVATNLNVDGKLSVLGGLNTSGGTTVVTGSSVGTPAIRNIGAGTGAKSGTATDGITGDIWIQYT